MHDHAAAPAKMLVPAGQVLHEVELELGRYVPPKQLEQCVEPGSENRAVGQEVQPVLPADTAMVPAAHAVHATAALALE